MIGFEKSTIIIKHRKIDVSMLKKISPYFWIILLAAALLPYLAGLDGELIFDDVKLIKKDPFYMEVNNPLQCWNRSFWKIEETQGLYRPLTLFSYWLEIRCYSFWANPETGLFEPGFRITNLILHLLVTLLVFKLALRLRFGRLTAFIAALIYALHPIHVEAVTPAFGRGELLCALFLLLALILHTYRQKSIGYVIGAGLCYMLSFMSKENGAAFLPICILMELYLTPWDELKLKSKMLHKSIPFVLYSIAAGFVFCLRKALLGSWLPEKLHFLPFIDNIIALSTPLLRVIAAVRIQGIALVKFFYPAVLSYDYSNAQIRPSETVFDPYAWLTLFLFLAIPGICIYLRPRFKRKILFLMGAYIIAILPAGNFIVPAGTIFAERLQYLPSVFLCLFSAGFLVQITRKFSPKLIISCIIIISILLSVRTFTRTFVWKNVMTLCISGLKSAPKSIKVWNNISVQLAGIGDFKGAIIASNKSIELFPEYATGYANRGLYYSKLGKYKEAKKDLRKALKISINHRHANFVLGLVYAQEGNPYKAKLVWERILKYYPRNPKLKKALKMVNEGQWGELKEPSLLETDKDNTRLKEKTENK